MALPKDPRTEVRVFLQKRILEIRDSVLLGEESSESFKNVLRESVRLAYKDQQLTADEIEQKVSMVVARTITENQAFLLEHEQAIQFLEHGDPEHALTLLRAEEAYYVGNLRELFGLQLPGSELVKLTNDLEELDYLSSLISRLEEWKDEQKAPSKH